MESRVCTSHTSLQQYRACVIDLLGMEIICGCITCTSHPNVVCLLFVPSLYSTIDLDSELVHFIVANTVVAAWNCAVWQVSLYQVSGSVHSERLVLGLVYVVHSLCPRGLHCQEACTVALLLHCLVLDVSGVAKMTSLYMNKNEPLTDLRHYTFERYLPSFNK